MPNALIELNGKQYSVKLGDEIIVSALNKEVGQTVKLDKILLLEVNGNTKVGQPYVEDINVEAEVVKNFRGPKIYVKKFKSKVRYRRKSGFRAQLTALKIIKIGEHSHIKAEKSVAKTTKTVAKKTKTTKTKTKK